MPQSCPPGFVWSNEAEMCEPDFSAGAPASDRGSANGSGGAPGECPPGQVWRTDSQGAYGSGQPGCEPEDWRSKQDKDTCLGARPNCGEGYDAWCDFTTAEWKCGWIGGASDPAGDKRRADWASTVRYGHAVPLPGTDLYTNDEMDGRECWTKDGEPVRCPAGYNFQGRGGGNGGGGFGYEGGGFPATPYELALAAQLGTLSSEFQKFAGSVFGVSFPAYKQGVDYYSTLLGKGGRGKMQAAVAPAAEQIAAGTEGTMRALGSGYLSGGAKDQAEIAARLQGQGEVAGLTQGVQPGAANALIEAGTAGMTQGQAATGNAAQVLSGLANLSVSSRLSGEGMDLQRELGFAGLEMEGQKLDLQRDLGFAGLDFNYAQLAESASQFRQQLGLQASMFDQQMEWERSRFGQQLQFDKEGRRIQERQFMTLRKDRKNEMKSQMLQSVGMLGAKTAMSAAVYKEDFKPAVEPAESLRRIAEEAAPALRGWRYKRGSQLESLADGREFDAALVLDLAPRYGLFPTEDAPGGRVVNVLALLGDLVGAVRALRDENRALVARLEAAEARAPRPEPEPGEGR